MANTQHTLGRSISSAPGKVILFGEHAVVHGKTAIATSLSSLRTWADLQILSQTAWNGRVLSKGELLQSVQSVQLILPDLGMNVVCENLQQNLVGFLNIAERRDTTGDIPQTITNYLLSILPGEFAKQDATHNTVKAIISFLYLFFAVSDMVFQTKPESTFSSLPTTTLRCEVRSQLPVGAGLGSSAAYSVALSAALMNLFGVVNTDPASSVGIAHQDLNLINTWAFQAEKILHGRPSGVDNTVSSYGGAISFRRGEKINIDFLKQTPPLRILLVNTQQERKTSELVARVGEFVKQNPQQGAEMLDKIHNISQTCVQKFSEYFQTGSSVDDFDVSMERLIDENHVLLCGLGVGHATLDKVVSTTAKYGVHSKLTGAGGGGCAFAYLRKGLDKEKLKNIIQDLEKEGFKCFEAEIGGNGVSIHSQAPQGIFEDTQQTSKSPKTSTPEPTTTVSNGVSTYLLIGGLAVISVGAFLLFKRR